MQIRINDFTLWDMVRQLTWLEDHDGSLDCSVKTSGEKGMGEPHSVKENLECTEISCISRESSVEYLWAKIWGVVSESLTVGICY